MMSGDPALVEYFPVRPINDEAKKKNKNLPGLGGVFNPVNLSLYHYAGNNPVKYIDPDGKILEIKGSKEFVAAVTTYLQKIDPNVSVEKGKVTTTSDNSTPGGALIKNLQDSKYTITIIEGKEKETDAENFENAHNGIGCDSTITFNQESTDPHYFTKDKNGVLSHAEESPLEIALGHELIHALHNALGERDIKKIDFLYITSGYFEGKYHSGISEITVRKAGYPYEEAKTIGLGEYSSDYITENNLREQLGYDIRITY